MFKRIYAPIIVFIVLLSASNKILAENNSEQLNALIKSKTLNIKTDNHGVFIIHFDDIKVSNAQLLDWELLHSAEKNKFYYLFMSMVYSSKPKGVGGRCSVGEEHILLWLKLNDQRKVLQVQQVAYSSCLMSLEIENPVGLMPPLGSKDILDNLKLVSEYINAAELQIVQYDKSKPDKGLKISVSALLEID